MDRISVIIPVYNAAKYLPQCLAALDAQTLKDFEPVLVNDGSTDDSLALCQAYAETHPKAKVLSRPNGGAAAARNTGLDAASGEFIAFWDADDIVSPAMLQSLLTLCVSNDCDIAQCGMLLVKPDAAETDYPDVLEKPELVTGQEAIARLYGKGYLDTAVLCNKLYRREMWQGLRIPTGHICEDEAIIHEVLYRAKRVAITPTPMYAYRQSAGSVMRAKGSLKRLDVLWALERRGDFLKQHGMNELYQLNQKLLLTQYLHCANYIGCECEQTPENRRKRYCLIAKYRAAWRALPAAACSRKQRLQYAVYALCPISERYISRWLEKRSR